MMKYLVTCLLVSILTAPLCAAQERIALEILEPPERRAAVRQWPVNVGLVFPDGELKDVAGGRLIDSEGNTPACVNEITGWWDAKRTRPKWLLLKFRADTDREYFFEVGGKPALPMGPAMVLASGKAGITIDTGTLRVRIDGRKPCLFADVKLNGKPMLTPMAAPHILVADEDGRQTPGRLGGWSVKLEENTSLRATVKAEGVFTLPGGKPLGRIELRYQFFRGESFVRLYHTLTWMVRDPKVGAREYALALQPAVGAKGRVRVGEFDYASKHTTIPWTPAVDVRARQDAADHCVIGSNGRVVKEGERLGGWISMEDADGRGVGVALRHAWQTWPTAFVVKKGALRVEFWPSQGKRMGFEWHDIMPPDMYNDAKYWNRFKWVEKKGHFLPEYWKNPAFVDTAEGAARTHELVIHFYDKSTKRTTAELNSVTQHPVVVRQDPASAMRVPFMGFDMEPVLEEYPDMERAIEGIGRMATGRWAKTHDYGLWRFGMMRWGGTGVCYRWMDGHQYDLQMIPILLFLRGGGRRWYEEMEATSRYVMDVATNHYNTRGAPTGYQARAAAMPFPWSTHHLGKGAKVHFLAYTYHLTGYKRAKEVMDKVIAGCTIAAKKTMRHPRVQYRGGWGREVYNMNVFWANAWEETFDPKIKHIADVFRGYVRDREYNAQLNVFRAPNIYLYQGLVQQMRLFKDEKLGRIMLRDLKGSGFPDMPDGGIRRTEDTPGIDWAYRVTGDKRYVTVGWDVARSLADLVPDHDWSSPEVPYYAISGNSMMRQFLLPIVTGYSNGARLGMKQNDPFAMRDTFISLPIVGGRAKGEIALRPRKDGPLKVRLLFIGRWNGRVKAMAVTAFDAKQQVAQATIAPKTPPKRVGRWYPRGGAHSHRGEIVIPNARKGKVCRLTIEGPPDKAPHVLVLADADIVQRVAMNPAMVYFANLAGQYYVGARFFTRATASTITMQNPYVKPSTIRDAKTGKALYHYNMADPKRSTFKVGKGRRLHITVTGRMDGRRFKGVSPWFARRPGEWFDPDEK